MFSSNEKSANTKNTCAQIVWQQRVAAIDPHSQILAETTLLACAPRQDLRFFS